jgi:hypothetical protein
MTKARNAMARDKMTSSRHILCAHSWCPHTHSCLSLPPSLLPCLLTGHDQGCRCRGRAAQGTKDASSGMPPFRQFFDSTHGCCFWRGARGGRRGDEEERTRTTCLLRYGRDGGALLESPASGLVPVIARRKERVRRTRGLHTQAFGLGPQAQHPRRLRHVLPSLAASAPSHSSPIIQLVCSISSKSYHG